MLIRGGKIHTMTAQGTSTGDILVEGGRIVAVGAGLDAPPDSCVLDAQGLTILPGLIDAQIHDGPETDDSLLQESQQGGVTTGLIWPEDEGLCRFITREGTRESRIHAVRTERRTDAQLHDTFLTLAESGLRIACEVSSAKECRRVLQAVHSARVKVILAGLAGCVELAEAVALSGCPVILGVAESRGESPWRLAVQLSQLGVPVALSCSFPRAKLRHLPLCAALCVREGMERTQAMRMITGAPAGLLGLPDAGCIKPGARADFAIYDGDPLLLATSHVMTIAGGKIRH